jgi:hypothetical protein
MEAGRIALHTGTSQSAAAFAGSRIESAVSGKPFVSTSLHETQGESNMKKLSHMPMLFAALLALTSFALARQQKPPEGQGGPDKLVEIVRNATQQYQNVANLPSDYGPVLGCVSGSDHGAMGIHYANAKLVNGGTLLTGQNLDPTRPQALIYEPSSNGQMKLVGVEFIILASALPPNATPQVEGHLMQFIDGPNRYGLPAFFELHVWAWRENPQGPFVDWNDHVTCAGQ